MKSKAALRRIASNEVPIADYIPFGVHLTPNIVKLRDTGDYIACWRLEGISFETAEFEALNAHKEALNNFLHALGGGRFALWTHKVRRRVTAGLDGTFTNRFCAELNRRYFDSLKDTRMMATELYLTVVYRPHPSKVANLFRRVAARTQGQIAAEQRHCLDMMDDIAKQLESSLRAYRPERLATSQRNGFAISALASFLGFLVNGVWEEVALRRASLSEYLPVSRLHFGDTNGLLQIEHPSGRKFAGFLDFKEYPGFSETGMNNVILYGDYEFIETQSFSLLNKRDALDRLQRQRNQLISGEEGSDTEIQEMQIAEDQLQSGTIGMGEYHFSLAVFGDSPEAVAKSLADAKSCFDEPGFRMAVVDVVPECAWFAQLPGNWNLRPREASITTYNFACLAPFHNFASGKRTGNPWGDALSMLKTPNGQPYFINFHASPENFDATDDKYPGHTTVLGSTGVGKTTTVAFLLAQADKYDARLVVFDKDRGMEILIRAMGGKYRTLRRGEPTGINPFQWTDTPATRALCIKLVGLCVRMEHQPLTPQEHDDITKAVNTVFAMPTALRRLGTVDQNLPNVGENSLRLRLKKWIGNNELGWVADNPRDTLDLNSSRKFGFDYTEFLDDPEVRPVVMLLLLHATKSLIDGTHVIYVMEEFWKPLADPIFADFNQDKLKTGRKESALGVFVTQSPSDVLQHPISKTVVEQSATLLFLPNPRAHYADYVDGFKVTPQEFEVIRTLPEAGRMFLVKQGTRSAIVKLDLAGFTDELVVLSGSVDNVKLLDVIRAQVGDAPEAWMPILMKQVAQRRVLAKSAREAA